MSIVMEKDNDVEMFRDSLNAIHTSTCPLKLTKLYNGWSKYTEEVLGATYVGPSALARICSETLEDKTCSVLDVGAGTGLVADELRKLGFTGQFDALEPAMDLIKEARDKNLYTNYYYEYVMEDQQCTIETDTYDALTVCGAIIPGHIRYQEIKELLRMCKKGGHVFICFRKDYLKHEQFEGIGEYLDALQRTGVCEVTTMEIPVYYLKDAGTVIILKKAL